MRVLNRLPNLFVIFIVLLSCENDDNNVDCTTALPAPDWFEIGFFNSQGDPLIGTVYQQADFRLFNSETEIFISPMLFGDSDRLLVPYREIESNKEYYIELTPSDMDTLNFNFESTQGPCFLNFDLQEVIYNGDTIQVLNTNRVDFIK
ncbi:hypothetical protein GTQ34_04165 [Muricauda sp. JGD-17]|uniref:Lipoprotein n=1 Tax=Flagellimonas ochracea TaxID=2696472 RepID=A0A964WWI9_9FLAO|nr:hypothetical protein [Allomuricauda ochracea]NAY91106.1 hypothetical protein [Allomuricauda ochracea]